MYAYTIDDDGINDYHKGFSLCTIEEEHFEKKEEYL
jgi:hypothetical protein